MTASKRIFLTGGASGIGRVTVERLLRAGHHVYVVDIDVAGLREAAHADGWRTERVTTAQLDITDAEAFERRLDEAEAHFGPVDVCMNIAGTLQPGWVADVEPADIDRQVDVNIKGVMHGTRLAARRMKERRSGHIINVASMAALAPVPGLAVYSATKYAVRAFSLCAALELAEQGVAVTVICPDAVDTPMLDLQEDYEEAAITFSNQSVLTADDVARVMVDEVIDRRPLEVTLPRSRGVIAKLANLAPEGGGLILPIMQRRGRAYQASRKARHKTRRG